LTGEASSGGVTPVGEEFCLTESIEALSSSKNEQSASGVNARHGSFDIENLMLIFGQPKS
jgi:hypothetical protein